MIKAYTDLIQSKNLAEILSYKTADNTHERVVISGCNFGVSEEQQYIHRDIPFTYFSGVGVPCWSLAALLDVLPDSQGRYTKSLYWFDDAWHCVYMDEDGEGVFGTSADNSLDACYKMVLKLNELNLL